MHEIEFQNIQKSISKLYCPCSSGQVGASRVTREERVETSLPAAGADVSCGRPLKLLGNNTSDISSFFLHNFGQQILPHLWHLWHLIYLWHVWYLWHFQNTRTEVSCRLPFKILGNIIWTKMALRIKFQVLLGPKYLISTWANWGFRAHWGLNQASGICFQVPHRCVDFGTQYEIKAWIRIIVYFSVGI